MSDFNNNQSASADYKERFFNKKLTERELKALGLGWFDEELPEDYFEVTTEYGENSRWSAPAQTIFEAYGDLWALDWSKGLTENQENEFYKQPYKVVAVEKVIKVTTYEKAE